ncbi:MAG: glycerophosphodiester phosphodiesterase family protein [Bacillota bacterium]|jgi:glycerophosphoryl diester phosphodiesterase
MKRLLFINYILLKNNLWTLLIFELIYKLLGILLIIPAIGGLFNLTLHLAGITYIAPGNFLEFLLSPFTIPLILVLAILLALYVLLEIFTFVIIFEASYVGYSIGVIPAVKKAFTKLKQVLYPKNYLLIVYMFAVIPFCGLTAISSLFVNLSWPDFMMQFIQLRPWLFVLYFIGYTYLCFMAIKWVFSTQFFVLRDCTAKEARYQARRLVKGRNFLTMGYGILYNLAVIAISSGVSFVIISIIKLISAVSQSGMLISAAGGFLLLIYMIVISLSVPLAFSLIAGLYYKYCEDKSYKLKITVRKKPPLSKMKKLVFVTVIGLMIISGGLTFKSVIDDNLYDNINIATQTLITGHRGSTVLAPENTLPALDAAIEAQADYAEIDIQQTKDGAIILLHDKSFSRTAGVNKNVWEVDYDEVQTFDAGSWFSKKFAGTTIPTLDEAIKHSQGKLMLNIEIKKTGHEKDFIPIVIKIIEDNNFINHCLISSLDYPTLQQVKEINPDIKTAYLMHFAAGDLQTLEEADIFCVEATFVTRNMINSAHAIGKEVHAWTVNSEADIRKLVSFRVDNIITDYPATVRDTVLSLKTNPLVSYLFWFK